MRKPQPQPVWGGRNGPFQIARFIHHHRTPGQELTAECRCQDRRGTLVTLFLSKACSAYLLIQPRTTCVEVPLPASIMNQKTCPVDMSTGQSEAPSSQLTPVCVKFTEVTSVADAFASPSHKHIHIEPQPFLVYPQHCMLLPHTKHCITLKAPQYF